ncbi:hypothetical protein [Candidatus Merdisoma sp. JLR.KK006]|jgi:hypothetical protein|uniref:hypothetical protein n=1 Tax=Candidatus Merdisoma sp. JLR.KK006 TaxID=3112626 RepID=UPI002FEFC950
MEKIKQFKANCDKFIVELHRIVDITKFNTEKWNVLSFNVEYGVITINVDGVKCNIFGEGNIIFKGAKDKEEVSAILEKIMLEI